MSCTIDGAIKKTYEELHKNVNITKNTFHKSRKISVEQSGNLKISITIYFNYVIIHQNSVNYKTLKIFSNSPRNKRLGLSIDCKTRPDLQNEACFTNVARLVSQRCVQSLKKKPQYCKALLRVLLCPSFQS